MTTTEQFEFSAKAKKTILITLVVGILLTVLGFFTGGAGHHDEGHGGHEEAAKTEVAAHHEGGHDAGHGDAHAEEAAHGEEAGHGGGHGEEKTMFDRFVVDLWINNVYFFGIAIVGLLFIAIQYAAQAGWSAGVKRIPLAFVPWIMVSLGVAAIIFGAFGHDLFHWTHESLYDKASGDYDPILDGKSGFFFFPLEAGSFPAFFWIRMILFFGVYILMFFKIKSLMLKEDIEGGDTYWRKLRKMSAIFIVFFAVTSPMFAWDNVMSIDPHWFSTMFGWYVFASWFVSGLAAITLVVSFLKGAGYLKVVNSNHLHDLGKFVFAFSIFWTYIWFSQFLLIYYANIPEETIYFIERLSSDQYTPIFFINLLLNFAFPFLMLMTRDAKRHILFLKIACVAVLFGHWIDFYLMITPGTLKSFGSFGLLEIGTIMVFGSAFAFLALTNLAKHPLVAKNHPMLEESMHHHI